MNSISHLLQRHTFGEAVRSSAYVVLACLVVGNALVRTRLPPKSSGGPPPDIKAWFREGPYMFTMIAYVLSSLMNALGCLLCIFIYQWPILKSGFLFSSNIHPGTSFLPSTVLCCVNRSANGRESISPPRWTPHTLLVMGPSCAKTTALFDEGH